MSLSNLVIIIRLKNVFKWLDGFQKNANFSKIKDKKSSFSSNQRLPTSSKHSKGGTPDNSKRWKHIFVTATVLEILYFSVIGYVRKKVGNRCFKPCMPNWRSVGFIRPNYMLYTAHNDLSTFMSDKYNKFSKLTEIFSIH